jgi:hypothetical protein
MAKILSLLFVLFCFCFPAYSTGQPIKYYLSDIDYLVVSDNPNRVEVHHIEGSQSYVTRLKCIREDEEGQYYYLIDVIGTYVSK